MDVFARCFLLVFGQLFVGGMLAISVPPFLEIERGFYKSTAGIFLGSGILSITGRLALAFWPAQGARAVDGIQALDMFLLLVSLTAGSVYLWSLWGTNSRVRARAFITTWIFGLASLAVAAQSFRLESGFSLEAFLFPILLVVSALVLGAVCTGMLLGHWYLIDSGLSLEPFHRVFRFFARVLALQSLLLVVGPLLVLVLGHSATAAAVSQLLNDHSSLVIARLLVSPLATAGLAWMIYRTLQIPQTMAATGLFYIAILSVLVGEFLGRFILFRTSLPL